MSELDLNKNEEDIIEEAGEPAEAEIAPKPAKKNAAAEFVEYLEILVFAVCFVILLYSFGVRLCTVSGSSMDTTLTENDRLLVSNILYTPKRGDIIVFHQTGTDGIKPLNEPVVKRVIATAGEKVSIEYVRGNPQKMIVTVTKLDGTVEVLEESGYIRLDPNLQSPYANTKAPILVPEGKLFVLGDNRNVSRDSRDSTIGLVDERRVLGKVLVRVGPLNKLGSVE